MINSVSLRSHATTIRAVLPYLALFGAILILPLGTSFAKQLFPTVGAAGTAAYRVGFSALLLLLVWRPWRRAWTRADLITVSLYGAAIGFMNLFFYLSIKTIPLGVALAIEFLGPLGVALYHSRRLSHLVWVALAVVGLALLLPLHGGAKALDPIGMLYALIAAAFWAAYIVFGQRAAHLHPGDTVAIGMTAGTLMIAPIGIAGAGMAWFSPEFLMLGFVAAVLSSTIPYSLDIIALRGVPKQTFGVLVAFEPAIGAIAGAILLAEALSVTQWLAIACIVAAGIGSVVSANRSMRTQPA